MRLFVVAMMAYGLAFAGATVPTCTPNGIQLIGRTYHQARAGLIAAGYRPMFPVGASADTADLPFGSVGYLECQGCQTGRDRCRCTWPGYTLIFDHFDGRIERVSCH